MNKTEFKKLLENRRLILDGATGSNLIKRGNMPSGVCPEKWILDNPEVLIGLQQDYFASGSNIVYSPTFTANRIKLAEYGLEDKVDEINSRLVGLSKEAVRRVNENAAASLSEDKAGDIASVRLIAGDLTMTGRQLKPMGDLEVTELINVYRQQIRALCDAGVDLLVVETMMSLPECRCALIAANEIAPDLPVMVTMTFEGNGRALFGTDPLTALVTLQALGADAFGVNCGAGPDTMLDIVKMLTDNSDIPVVVKPNAGLPSLNEDGTTSYSMSAEDFYEAMKPIFDLGVSIIGGCCGTAPEFIEKVRYLDEEMKYEPSFVKGGLRSRGVFALSSERLTCTFDLESNFIIVGERINPTGKKALQAQLREEDFEMVRDFAEKQEMYGAKILDVNMGMSGIDEKATMIRAIEEVTSVTNLPLSLDTSDPEVMEAALMHYPGRALVNSVSLEEVKIKKMLPLVKKYGAMMILLPLSDEGIPETMEAKHEIIRRILEEAYAVGLSDYDIVVDGLVATVGANKNAAIETLNTISHCHDDLKLPTICGLSNISFGLPERSFVNAAFLTMAISAGLTMAISNPNQDLLANTAFACDLLRNKPEADLKYIGRVSSRKEELDENNRIVSLYGGKEMDLSHGGVASLGAQGALTAAPSKNDGVAGMDVRIKPVYDAVIKGNKDRIVDHTKKAVEDGADPGSVLDDALLPAIGVVGEYFDKGRYFLPQLIASAQTMERSIEYLEPLLAKQGGDRQVKGKIVIATVKGDIHDIGKNLVALMLKNNGYTVFDLGKDVPKEDIVEKAISEDADIIALSALMTTTMKQMDDVVAYAKEKGCRACIMIGGAVITQDYSDQIGADGYSADAAEAVKLAWKLVTK